MEAFNVDFKGAAIEATVKTYSGDDEFKTAVSKGQVDFAKPFVVASSAAFTGFAEDASSKLKATLDRWNLQFVSSDVAHQNDMVHYYLAPSHGCEDAKTISEI